MVPRGTDQYGEAPELPDPDHLPLRPALHDYFWFGKIISINSDTQMAHLQWFSHGLSTHLQDIYDPQELFLVDNCDSVDLRTILGKVAVHRCPALPTPSIREGEYFYKYVLDLHLSAVVLTLSE